MPTENEIREAVRRHEESTESHNVSWIHTLADFANRYLSIKGMPKEKETKVFAGNFDRTAAIMSARERGESDDYNSAIQDCKLAVVKKLRGFTPYKLHEWYLEATKNLHPLNYNEKAQKPYNELNPEQQFIDRFITDKITNYLMEE